MSKITRFEDLRSWQLARELVRMVYALTEEGKFNRDRDTKSQIKRAALSVMNNVAEGFGRVSNKEFVRFLGIAQSSCIEVKSITYALEDCEYLPIDKIMVLRDKTE